MVCTLNSKVIDIQTGETSDYQESETSDLGEYWRRKYIIPQSADPRWAPIRITDRTENPEVVDGEDLHQILIIKGADSLFVSVSDWTVYEKAYSYNYPYFWMSKITEQDLTVWQTIIQYDAEGHTVSEYAFKLPDESGYGADFRYPASQDIEHIWYNDEDLGLFGFDKRDQQVYRYPLGIEGQWYFIGVDSMLIYFFDPLAGQFLAMNKQWLEKNRVVFDGGKSLNSMLEFQQLFDSLDIYRAPDLEQFIQKYNALKRSFGDSGNQTIQAELDDLRYTFLRRMTDSDFADQAFKQVPALESEIPKELMPFLCHGLMEYTIHRGDLDGYAVFYKKIQQIRPAYFFEESNAVGAACVAKDLAVHKKWLQIQQQKMAPDELLWEKGALVNAHFTGNMCYITRKNGKPFPEGPNIPTAHVYAELARQYPNSKYAQQAVCKVLEWHQEGTKFPLEIWDALYLVPRSNCSTGVEVALFQALVFTSGNDRQANLLRALDLGRQLLKKEINPAEKTNIESWLDAIDAELKDPDDGN